jgi:hypothetical protein
MILKHTKTNFWKVAFGLLLVMLPALYVNFQLGANTNINDANAVIRGRVIDEDGNPVAGALVRPGHIYSLREQPAISKTDADGRFQFEMESKHVNPWLGFYAVTEDQTLLADTRIKFEEGVAAIPELTITLKPGRVITGTVVDQNGQPVEGATVAGVNQITYPNLVTTDVEGKFRFAYPTGLSPLQEVYAFKEGIGFDYLCTEEIDIYQGNTPPEKISDGPFTLTLSPFKPVEIKVVNENNEPLPGVKVAPWLINKQEEKDCLNTSGAPDFFDCWTTNADGIATLECLPEWAIERTRYTAYGPMEGVVHNDNTRAFYGNDDKRMEEFDNRQLTLTNVMQQFQNLTKDKKYKFIPTFVLPLRARVTGTVKLPDGTPVPWTRITRKNHAACGHGIRYTDANGVFELFENANEKLDLAVDGSRFGATPGVFAFDVGDGTTEKRLDFVLEKGIRLHGTIYGLDGKPADKEYQVFIHENDPNPEPCDPDSENCPDGGCPVGVVIRQTSNYGADVLDGKYEYILPAVTRSYRISADLYGAEGRDSHEFALLGDEEDYELDLHLKLEDDEE